MGSNGKTIGSIRARVQDGTVYIGRVIVHPEHQGHGLGRQLLESIEESFPEADRYELFTGHLSQRNLHLYRSHGYHEFRRTPQNSHTIVFLEKPGHAPSGA